MCPAEHHWFINCTLKNEKKQCVCVHCKNKYKNVHTESAGYYQEQIIPKLGGKPINAQNITATNSKKRGRKR